MRSPGPPEPSRWGVGVGPDDIAVGVVIATLSVICIALALALAFGRPVALALGVHASVAAAVVVVSGVARRRASRGTRSVVTAATVIGAMFFLYGSLGRVAFVAIPWDADPWLRAADRLIGLGSEPAVTVGGLVERNAWVVEPLAVVYAAFIPYLYLSIFLGLVGRPERTRGIFVLAFALLYGTAFMGYLFLPARGPIASMGDVLTTALNGGAVHALVVRTIDGMGGPHGAFPSLHVGASCLAALTDLRHGDSLRGSLYLPLVALIAVATVALQYHYAVDVVAGGALAYGALRVAERVLGAPTLRPRSESDSGHSVRGPGAPYRVARGALRLSMLGFFRRVEIQGKERIRAVGPVLLVSNHTNAFVDPLVLLVGLRRRLTLTAKSTLAHNPLLVPVLRAFNVVLFRRAGDEDPGVGDAHNERALADCAERLRRGEALLIFPEGVSHSDPAMRPFKTGAARVAAAFRERDPGGTLHIVPIGLHYTRKDGWRSDAVAWVGRPVELETWISGSGHAKTEAVDVTELTDDMRRWIEQLTLGYGTEEERVLLEDAAALLAYDPEGPTPLDRTERFDAGARVRLLHRLRRGARALRGRDAARFSEISNEARALTEALDRRGVTAAEVGLPMRFGRAALFVIREMEVLVIGAPLAVAGWLANFPPFALTRRIVRRMSRDEDHTASNAVFIAPPVFLAWWTLLAVLALALLDGWWPALAACAVPLAGAVHLGYRDRAGGVVRRVRTFVRWLVNPDDRLAMATRLERWSEDLLSVEAALALHDPSETEGA